MSAGDPERERRRRTLEELEGSRWGPPPCPSHVVTGCPRLRTKPIGEPTIEELRLLIEQGIGLLFLLPLALETLQREPLAEGDFFPGDLLLNVLRTDAAYLGRNPEARRRVLAILEHVGACDAERFELVSELDAAMRAFHVR